MKMVRVINRDTGEFLHLSDKGDTSDINYSYLAWKEQCDNLQLDPSQYQKVSASVFGVSA